MITKQLYIIRHGQTDYNLQGIVQGSGVNSSLNETGRKQAEAFYRKYNRIPFQRIYTSALKRTHETVHPFINRNIPHTQLAGLNEINWGRHEGMRPTPDEKAYYNGVISSWRSGEVNRAVDKGESPVAVQQRQAIALEKILTDPEELALICMHGRAMRIFLCLMLDIPLKEMDSFEHTNLCLYVLEHNSNTFKLKVRNDTDHLLHLG